MYKSNLQSEYLWKIHDSGEACHHNPIKYCAVHLYILSTYLVETSGVNTGHKYHSDNLHIQQCFLPQHQLFDGPSLFR